MWCDNLPRLRGKLSEVTFSYKMVIKTIVLRLKKIRYCSTVWGSLKTLAFLNIECKEYKNLETKCVTTSPGLPYRFLFSYSYTRSQSIFSLSSSPIINVTLCRKNGSKRISSSNTMTLL